MRPLAFPKNFLFGSATAGLQIEGGDIHSNWYHWSLQGRIKDNESSLPASDHYARYEEDIELMKQMNHQVYRMSVEWSRIEPEKGQWSDEALQHYRAEILALQAAGIKPLITLHHFAHPQWFELEGQWTEAKSVYYFLRYVKTFLRACGDLVNEYCTINEPNVFAMSSFIEGNFPPGKTDDVLNYLRVSNNLILAHQKAYVLIHEYREKLGYADTSVGFAMHITHLEPLTGSRRASFSKKAMEYLFHKVFFQGMIEGKAIPLIGLLKNAERKRFADFLGINYYTRHIIFPSNNPAMLFGDALINPDIPQEDLTDMGWEVYPEGLYYGLKPLYEKYRLQIYITENGIADDTDDKRPSYIYHHLAQIHRLIAEGVKVERYYYWSTMDNFEWHDGYGPRFGLIAIDYQTQERSIRPSGYFYGEICREKMVTLPMIEKYLIKNTASEES